MEALKQGEIRVHLKGGNSYVCPEANKQRVMNCLGDSVAKIEHFKPIVAELITPKPKAKKEKKTEKKTVKKDDKK